MNALKINWLGGQEMQQGDRARTQGTWHPPAFWLIVAAISAFVGFGTNLMEIHYTYFAQDEAGSWGFSYKRMDRPFIRITRVEAGSAAQGQGLKSGDIVQFHGHWAPKRLVPVGERLVLTRMSPPPVKDLDLTARRVTPAPLAVPDPLVRALDDIVRVLMLLGGAVILWRGWNRRSSFLLGTSLIGMAYFPPEWLPMSATTYVFWSLTGNFIATGASWILVGFAMAYIREIGVRVPRWMVWLLIIFIIPGVLNLLIFGILPQLAGPWIINPFMALYSTVAGPFPLILTMIVLLHGWRCGSAQSRHRTALLTLAVGILIIGNLLFGFFTSLVLNQANPSLLTETSIVTRIIGLILFTYAILRHRVIDFGFTVNRTLVYGSVSLILLATFGLLEWGVHHLLEIEGKESSPLIDAGLAVSIFLAFHPVRDFVEHYVERWFFSSWQKAETQLKRFVASAGHFNSKPVLCEAFAKELSHYADGAEAALYMAQEGGAYRLTAGYLAGADEQYEDNPAFALMRSEREPIDLTHGEVTLPGALALPMLDQGYLTGFALLAGKPDGSHFRPDELENLGWAAHQVGLDLQALHARELERDNTRLTGENAMLREDRERLTALLAKPNAA